MVCSKSRYHLGIYLFLKFTILNGRNVFGHPNFSEHMCPSVVRKPSHLVELFLLPTYIQLYIYNIFLKIKFYEYVYGKNHLL